MDSGEQGLKVGFMEFSGVRIVGGPVGLLLRLFSQSYIFFVPRTHLEAGRISKGVFRVARGFLASFW